MGNRTAPREVLIHRLEAVTRRHGVSVAPGVWLDDILAIEDEAVKAERERLRNEVQAVWLQSGPWSYFDWPGDPYRAVIDLLEAREEAEEPGLDRLRRLEAFAEKVAASKNDTAGTRAAARYALTGSLEGVVDEMRQEARDGE